MLKKLFVRILVVFVLVPFVAVADNLSDLKARSEEAIKIANSLDANDIEAYIAMFHPQALGIARNGPTVSDMTEVTKDQFVANRTQQIAQMEISTSAWIDPVYRVIGNTGYVFGLMRGTVKLKDGPITTRFSRLSLTFAKSGGKWLLTSWHFSDMPADET